MKPSHAHSTEQVEKLLKLGIVLSVFVFILELAGGFWAQSLALMSDAGHVAIDLWALVLSFLAVYLAARPVSDRQTYGLHRMEVMAALANGFLVLILAFGILYAAVKRYQDPPFVQGGVVLVIGSIGLVFNVVLARMFYKQSEQDLNLRGAVLHLVSDALGSVAVLVSGIVILLTGWRQIDVIVSALIALLVLSGAYRLLRDGFETLLEGVPRGIKVTAVEDEIKRVEGVISVHDLHIWSICSHLKALSGHVLIDPGHLPRQEVVLEGIHRGLRERFGITHTTIQLEAKGWPGVEVQY